MKSGFWKTDWFLGLVVVLLMFFASGSDLLQSLERKAYDLGVQASSRTPSDKIAVIAIDDTSIANIGRWPWSRDVHAKMTDLLAGAKAKVIGNTVFLFEPQIDPGYQYITKLLELAAKVAARRRRAPAPIARAAEGSRAGAEHRPAGWRRATPRRATCCCRCCSPSTCRAASRTSRWPTTCRRTPFRCKDAELGALPTSAVQVPLDSLGRAAAGLGHLNANPDVDGGIRTEPLVLRYFDQHFPSLSMMIAAQQPEPRPGRHQGPRRTRA